MNAQELARRRGPLRLLSLAVAGVLLSLSVVAASVLAGAAPAWAHAQLVGTDPAEGSVLPAAPKSVTLTFTESIRLTSRGVSTYDATAEPVTASARVFDDQVVVDLPDDLARGTYLVAWFVVSQDGHPISGTLTFSIGERSAVVVQPPALDASAASMTVDRGLLAGLTVLGVFLAGGLALFVALVVPAAAARVRGAARTGFVVGMLSAWTQVFAASAYAQGVGWGGLSKFDASLVGPEITVAVLVTLGLGLVLACLHRRLLSPLSRVLLMASATVAVTAPAWAGHTRAYGPAWLVLGSDAVHLLAGATWVGGLVGLVMVLRTEDGGGERAAQTLSRFSTLAAGVLLAVTGSGVLLGWRILGSWSGLIETRYGVLLLVKVGLTLVVVAAAAWNRWRLLPRLRVLGSRERAHRLLRRSLTFEAALLGVVLAVAGFLSNQPPVDLPAPPPEPKPVAETVELGDLLVSVDLTPGSTGGNTLALQVHDADGRATEPPRTPVVELRSETFDLGTLALNDRGVGAYEVLLPIPSGGAWELQVGLRLSRFENPVATITFEIPDRPLVSS